MIDKLSVPTDIWGINHYLPRCTNFKFKYNFVVEPIYGTRKFYSYETKAHYQTM